MTSARRAFEERPLTLVHEDIRVPLILGPRMSPLMEASLEAAPGQFDQMTDAVDASLRPVGTAGPHESADRRSPLRPVRIVTGYDGFSEATIGSPTLYRRNVVHVLDQLTGSRPASWGPSSGTAR
jgi:hypothetical protein